MFDVAMSALGWLVLAGFCTILYQIFAERGGRRR